MKKKFLNMKQKVDGRLKKAGKWLSIKTNKVKTYVTYLSLSLLTSPITSHAGDGTEDWNTAMEFIVTWVPRLGALMLFGGAIEYAIAYQSENSNQKTQATRFMVAGGMVMGVAEALKSLIMI